jgi:hypothetical protein
MTIATHHLLASHWINRMTVPAGFIGLVLGTLMGAWIVGTRMVRAHARRGFCYLRGVNQHEQRSVAADDIRVAFDTSMVDERDSRLDEWSRT